METLCNVRLVEQDAHSDGMPAQDMPMQIAQVMPTAPELGWKSQEKKMQESDEKACIANAAA